MDAVSCRRASPSAAPSSSSWWRTETRPGTDRLSPSTSSAVTRTAASTWIRVACCRSPLRSERRSNPITSSRFRYDAHLRAPRLPSWIPRRVSLYHDISNCSRLCCFHPDKNLFLSYLSKIHIFAFILAEPQGRKMKIWQIAALQKKLQSVYCSPGWVAKCWWCSAVSPVASAAALLTALSGEAGVTLANRRGSRGVSPRFGCQRSRVQVPDEPPCDRRGRTLLIFK